MFGMFKRPLGNAEGTKLPPKSKEILPDKDEAGLENDPRGEEKPVKIVSDGEGGWTTEDAEIENERQALVDEQDVDDLEAIGRPETIEELAREDAYEANYNAPDSIQGETLYDIQHDSAKESVSVNDGLIEGDDKHEVEKIVAKLDSEIEAVRIASYEDKPIESGKMARYGEVYRARGANSKPEEKDYKGGERIAKGIATEDDTQARQDEILARLDEMAQ